MMFTLLIIITWLQLVCCNHIDSFSGYFNAHIKQLPYVRSNYAKITNSTTHKNLEPKIEGVSLGGWLVLEPWITPSLFENVEKDTGLLPIDEYTFSQILGNKTYEVLHKHWSTWVTEQDIRDIKNYGLNLVRIPIGYWAFQKLNGDPFISGQESFLDRAIQWCSSNGLRVLIDIHGMPGSQNGFDNSGRRSSSPFWLDNDETIDMSFEVINYVLDKYGSNPSIHSIEAVNEPFAYVIGMDKIKEFHTNVYNLFKLKNCTAELHLSDGFAPISDWSDFLPEANFTMDHHIYEIFTNDQIRLTTQQHLDNVVNIGGQLLQENHENIVGEFSGALTDCTKYINGVGTGARYDGTIGNTVATGSCANHTNFDSWTQQAKTDTQKYLQLQLETYTNNTKGWIFWCYKTEDTIEWDFRRATEFGLLPKLEGYVSSSSIPLSSPGLQQVDDFTLEGGSISMSSDYRTVGVLALTCCLLLISLSR